MRALARRSQVRYSALAVAIAVRSWQKRATAQQRRQDAARRVSAPGRGRQPRGRGRPSRRNRGRRSGGLGRTQCTAEWVRRQRGAARQERARTHHLGKKYVRRGAAQSRPRCERRWQRLPSKRRRRRRCGRASGRAQPPAAPTLRGRKREVGALCVVGAEPPGIDVEERDQFRVLESAHALVANRVVPLREAGRAVRTRDCEWLEGGLQGT